MRKRKTVVLVEAVGALELSHEAVLPLLACATCEAVASYIVQGDGPGTRRRKCGLIRALFKAPASSTRHSSNGSIFGAKRLAHAVLSLGRRRDNKAVQRLIGEVSSRASYVPPVQRAGNIWCGSGCGQVGRFGCGLWRGVSPSARAASRLLKKWLAAGL